VTVDRPGRDVGTFLRGIDWIMLLCVAALVGYGLWAIAGITKHDVAGDRNYFVTRQAIFAAIGGVGLIVALLVDPERYRRHARVLYVVLAGLLAFVLAAGAATRGSRRWIDFGFFQFQPSEVGKLLFVLALAAFLIDRGRRAGDRSAVFAVVALALVPIGLVFVQPDLGTALVYVAALGAVFFVAGVRWADLATLGAVSLTAVVALVWLLPAVGVQVLKPYQSARITAFADRTSDPAGATYNVNQSIVAVGAGGLWGRGVEGATQTNLDYLPEHATDFVFASLAEQRGFVGASALLLLYLLLLWRGLRTISLARDGYSAAVAGGIVFAFLCQIFVNVGMTMGVAPVTGIPLPFFSVGGSSMIFSLTAIGVLQAIHVRGRLARRR
jgi:rod shape determining protein RodA